MCLWTASCASGSSGASEKGFRTLSHRNWVAWRCRASSSSGVKALPRPPGEPWWTPCWAGIKRCRSARCRPSVMLKCRSHCADPAAAAPCSARSSPRRGPSSAAREAGVRRPLDPAPPRRPGGLPRLLLSLTAARLATQADAARPICPLRKSASSASNSHRSTLGASIDRPRNQLYGYDRERFDDATTLNDTTRDDATHDTLPTPTTTHATNVERNTD